MQNAKKRIVAPSRERTALRTMTDAAEDLILEPARLGNSAIKRVATEARSPSLSESPGNARNNAASF